MGHYGTFKEKENFCLHTVLYAGIIQHLYTYCTIYRHYTTFVYILYYMQALTTTFAK